MSAAEQLPVRRVGGNYGQPGQLRRGAHPQKYFLTDAARELLLTEYDSTNRRAIAKRLQVPPHVVTKWAGELGVRRTKEAPWSPDDIAYLRKSIARVGWKTIARKLGRTIVAVKLKAKRLELHKIQDGGWTQNALATLLGVDSHRVKRWIDLDWLDAARRHTDRQACQGGDAYLITPAALRTFLRDHGNVIDVRRVDRDWLLELAFGAPEWTGDLYACAHCTTPFRSRSEIPPKVCAGCAARDAARSAR